MRAQGLWGARRRCAARVVRSRRVGRFAGILRRKGRSRVRWDRVLRTFIPQAGAYLLDCAAQFVEEGATRPSIVAQMIEFIPDALEFWIGSG